MSNLENLINKIVAGSKEKAVNITDDANVQAKKIVDELVTAANKEKEEILLNGQAEAEKTKNLIISKKKIEIRDGKLSAKQELIKRAFALALEKLNQLPLPEYEGFLTAYLSKTALSGDETLIIPKRYEGLNINAINEKLSSSGKLVKLTLAAGQTDINGGFILQKDDALNNNTFEALIDYYRDDLEKIVSDSLL